MEISKFINKKSLARKLNTSPSTIYRWAKNGYMPKPISIGPNKTLWIEEEIVSWINDLKNKSRGFGDQVCKVKKVKDEK